VFGLSRGSLLPGWIGCAPQGAHTAFALVQPGAEGKPAVRWTAHLAWDQPVTVLQQLRRRHALHRHRCVALLPRNQYQCMTMDAPADLPREDWAAAVRWQLKDSVAFAVDSAAVDVLAVPEGTSYRAQAQLIAVAAADSAVRPLVEQAADAGAPWQAIDIAETALRNLSALVEPEGRAQALLHCQADHATLVVTYGGELLSTRQMELSLVQPEGTDEAHRQHAYDQAGLELQRTLDGIERAFGQVTLARLLITPMPGVQALCDHLTPLLYVPVAPLALDGVLDFSAVPELLADPALLNQQLCAIGAALREPA
jgi:MSHA biogenesis protein MshI